MKLNKALVSFLIILVVCLFSFNKKDNDPFEQLLSSLQKWYETNPQEKVYLQTDKPYYILGDTIWFKAYLTVGNKHQLSALSGALYVDLINEADSLVQSLKLPVMAGMAKGNLVLSDSIIREGNYRIRAYTQWMRNAGDEYFYNQTFNIGNANVNTVFAEVAYKYIDEGDQGKTQVILKYLDEHGFPYQNRQVKYSLKQFSNDVTTGSGKTDQKGELIIVLPTIKMVKKNLYLQTVVNVTDETKVIKTFPFRDISSQSDVQFFPEGGHLVNGIRSRVAFKAVGSNGLGFSVKGRIVDDLGVEVAVIEAKHLGMGYFNISPNKGRFYTAEISYPDGSSKRLKLPAALNDGYVLSIYNNTAKDSTLVRVQSTAKDKQELNLLAQSGGTVYFAAKLAIRNSITSVYIPTQQIPSGILQVTLFSTEGKPLNERISFVHSNDAMNLKLSSSMVEYLSREKIDLELQANNTAGRPIFGNFSVSVVSEALVPVEESTTNSIFAQLLLSSDIKGYIEKPNYYFQQATDQVKEDLDILLMTQGYRRFRWEDMQLNNESPPEFKAEKLITEIKGRLLTLGNKPVKRGQVTILNNKISFFEKTVTDDNGYFKFENLLLTNGLDFSIMGRTAGNSNRVVVQMDEINDQQIYPNPNIFDFNLQPSVKMRPDAQNYDPQGEELLKLIKTSRQAHQLKEVQIRSEKKWGFGTDINERQADQVFRPDLKQPCKTLRECIEEMKNNLSVQFRYITDTSEVACGPIWVPFTKDSRQFKVIVDNMIIEDCDYQTLLLSTPTDIDKIYFSYNGSTMSARLLGGRLGKNLTPPPVIAIYTKSGNFRKSFDPSIVVVSPRGFNKVKEFYIPKYEASKQDVEKLDLRSTVYWNPSVRSGKDGKAHFSYYNSDMKGQYRVIVEGIDSMGSIGRVVYRYQVK